METSYEVICLSEYPKFLDQCVDLLNEQWPRSRTARLRSLEQTQCGSFPTSLLLVRNSSGEEIVVGHSKVLPVPYSEDSCFVESVVVSKKLRGQGLGRRMMEGTEEFVKKKGITAIHLTTHDQQGFYEKLGYSLSVPVIVYGGISSNLQKLMESNQTRDNHKPDSGQQSKPNHDIITDIACHPAALPPPPPPPVPRVDRLPDDKFVKVCMVKQLI